MTYIIRNACDLQSIFISKNDFESSWILRENPFGFDSLLFVEIIEVPSCNRIGHIREPDEDILGFRNKLNVIN